MICGLFDTEDRLLALFENPKMEEIYDFFNESIADIDSDFIVKLISYKKATVNEKTYYLQSIETEKCFLGYNGTDL